MTHRQMTLMLFEDMITGEIKRVREGKERVEERADVKHESVHALQLWPALQHHGPLRPQLAIYHIGTHCSRQTSFTVTGRVKVIRLQIFYGATTQELIDALIPRRSPLRVGRQASLGLTMPWDAGVLAAPLPSQRNPPHLSIPSRYL
jgi:hypothetical protein